MTVSKIGCVTLVLALLGCGGKPTTPTKVPTPEGLISHSAEFRREIITVAEGVHVAVGYGLANVVLLEGERGCVVVDTLGSVEAGRLLLRDFREITEKPIEALIYTHNHADHVFGAAAFAEGRDIPVYAHETTQGHIDEVVGVLRPVLARRGFRMFGTYLEDEAFVNAGIGARLDLDAKSTVGVLRPTHTFRDVLKV